MKNLSSLLLTIFAVPTIFYSVIPPQVLSEPHLAQNTQSKDTVNLQKKAESIILMLSKKKYAQARNELATPIQNFWTSEKIGQLWEKRVLAEQGDFQKILNSRQVDIVNGNLVIVKTQFSNKVGNLIITFNNRGEVVGFDFPETMGVEEIARKFTENIGKNEYGLARQYLHPFLKAEVFPAKIKARSEAIQAKLGAFQKVLDVEIKEMSPDQDLALVKVQFQKGEQEVFLIIDKQKNILGVDFPES
jgi:hypothetical protein